MGVCYCGAFKPVEEEIVTNLQRAATGYWSKERNHADSEVKEPRQKLAGAF